MAERLYTTNQLAKLFGVVPTTVIDWIERGKLEAFKTLGGHRRITHQAVLDFLHRHRLPYPPAFAENAPKIVLMEGDPGALAEHGAALRAGFSHAQVFLEPHPVDALLRIGHERPALVILDLGSNLATESSAAASAGIDGFELCRRLRDHPDLEQVKILVLVAEPSELTAERARAAGADATLPRMWAAAELVEQCRKLLPAPGAA
jgi:excisionase family DNA binding protein